MHTKGGAPVLPGPAREGRAASLYRLWTLLAAGPGAGGSGSASAQCGKAARSPVLHGSPPDES